MCAFIFCFYEFFGILFLFSVAILYTKTLYNEKIKCYNVIASAAIPLLKHKPADTESALAVYGKR